MIPNLPAYISIAFALTVVSTLLLVYRTISKASQERVRQRAMPILLGMLAWLIIQAVLTLTGVYQTIPVSGPPRLVVFGILPAMLIVILLSATRRGRRFMDSLALTSITYFHTLRVVVEMVLYWLYLYKAVPELMTFEGRNYDILAGLTAPVVAYFGFVKKTLPARVVLLWNLVCLGLLLNIIGIALLSAPSPFQQFAFQQPNRAVAYFPFSWLPTFIVPLVLLGHVTAIRRLVRSEAKQPQPTRQVPNGEPDCRHSRQSPA